MSWLYRTEETTDSMQVTGASVSLSLSLSLSLVLIFTKREETVKAVFAISKREHHDVEM